MWTQQICIWAQQCQVFILSSGAVWVIIDSTGHNWLQAKGYWEMYHYWCMECLQEKELLKWGCEKLLKNQLDKIPP